jgi:Matrixin/Putative peptidoglycan binding domain
MPKEKIDIFSKISEAEFAKAGERKSGIEFVQDYLKRFGYFQSLTFNSGEIDNATSNALRIFQERNKLPITGEFDSMSKSEMIKPRCGLPDMHNGIEFATVCAWNRVPRNLTFAFDHGTNAVPAQGEFQAVRNAFSTWSTAFPYFTFTEVALTANPNIVIDWRNANDPDHSMVGPVIAHSDFPIGCEVVTNNFPRPFHFDDSEHTWSIGAVMNAFDVESVALHEIGHILGLAHTSVAGAVMFQSISPNSTLRVLQEDDKRSMNSLYVVGEGVLRQFGANSVVGVGGFYGGNTDQNQHVIVGTTDGNVHELYWGPPVGQVGHSILRQFGANSIVGVGGFYGGDIDQNQHAIVATTDGNVHELYWGPPVGQVEHGVLTQFGAIAGVGGFYGGDIDQNQHAIVATRDDVHEIYWGPTGQGQDLLSQFGANSVVGVAGFYGGNTDNHQHVIVSTAGGRVYELYWQGPNPASRSVLKGLGAGSVGGFYGGNFDNHQHAIVATTDGNVHELYWPLP